MHLKRLFLSERRQEKQAAKDLYDVVLRGALAPQIYLNHLAEDTFDGRFEQVALHGALVMMALRDRKSQKLSEALLKQIFDGFDYAYRETGVGDSSISRKVRTLGERFYGLARGLEKALRSETNEALAAFVSRNALADNSKDLLVSYLRSARERLSHVKDLSTVDWPHV